MPGPALALNISEYTPEDAEEYASLTITQNYVLYAISALLVYELIVTFDEEVERVWSLRWRLPKLIFMFNRYITRGLLILQYIVGGYPGTSERFCEIYAYWQVIPPRLAILAAQAIMIIRLWAIYNNSRKMLCTLIVLYVLEVAAVVLCMAVATVNTQGASQPRPLGCGLEPLSPMLREYASGTWIAPVCFELVTLLMTLVKVFPPLPSHFLGKANIMKGLSITTRERNPTLNMLARDSIIYFAFIFTFTLANAVIYETSFSSYYRSILLGPTSAISCIAVSRMIINIRSLPAPNLGEGPSMNMIRSDVMFAGNSALSGISEVRRSSGTPTLRGRVTGKEREEMGDFEMICTAEYEDDIEEV
ncbi:hypothetical protein C8F04DRAFT_1250055 [Mycena alexandri]|uniref:DUF6533 domain-containing protein n=1 Tax=Mycena alexandri TaxID=1745969 RepID=A0AAD6TGP1_9AGAR|nr:hypothetical protein C8F04DRAFT_1250055 [Mycena alexandri]